MPDHSRRATSGKPLLADGCYFIAYAPREVGVIYQGTLRVDSRSGQVHEIGHAMGLGHKLSGTSFMRPTDGIADSATPDMPFPGNIAWSFAPEDEHRLRHWPDIIVRPGGAASGAGAISPLGG